MKLPFDHNISPKLVGRLADLFPGSAHVLTFGLDCAPDDQIWIHAIQHDFALVTKDEDYENLSTLKGSPPKVIRLTIGNCSTKEVEELFRSNLQVLLAFETDHEANILLLGD